MRSEEKKRFFVLRSTHETFHQPPSSRLAGIQCLCSCIYHMILKTCNSRPLNYISSRSITKTAKTLDSGAKRRRNDDLKGIATQPPSAGMTKGIATQPPSAGMTTRKRDSNHRAILTDGPSGCPDGDLRQKTRSRAMDTFIAFDPHKRCTLAETEDIWTIGTRRFRVNHSHGADPS